MKMIRFANWAQFLKTKRQARYRSAREFCVQAGLGISYPQYSRYESGEQLPSLPQALVIAQSLGIPTLEAVLEWSRAQITPAQDVARTEVDAMLSRLRAPDAPSPPAPTEAATDTLPVISLDEVIVFNRSHLNLFLKDPRYRDIFTYVNSFSPRGLMMDEIARAIGADRAQTDEMVGALCDLGVLTREGDAVRSHKRTFYFPDDAEFFELRHRNLKHNAEDVLRRMTHTDLTAERAYRGVLTRELTSSQVSHVVSRLERLMSEVAHLPETDHPDEVFSLCLLFGGRFSRSQAQAAPQSGAGVRPGLTRQAKTADEASPGIEKA